MRLFSGLFVLCSICSVSATRATHVKQGGSIQAALDAASPGDKIVVESGPYYEQLRITTDDIELAGHNAILMPPESPVENECTLLAPNRFAPDLRTQAGICLVGYKVELQDLELVKEHREVLSVGRYVKGVSISGFEIKGFSGLSIAIVGAKDTRIRDNKVFNSDIYGMLTVGSINTRIYKNRVASTDTLRFIGICMDDKSDVHVTSNKISAYGIGLCVQTNGADVSNNDVSAGCIGAFIDPNVTKAWVVDNKFHDPDATCKTNGYGGAFGVIINGADKSTVKNNKISGQTYGIAIFDDTTSTPTTFAEDNKVSENKLESNENDFWVLSTGEGNVIRKNKCNTPGGFCMRK